MPVITSIKLQKNKKRVNIHLDNKFAFGLDLESFVKLGLKVEQELSETEVEKIVKKAEFQKVNDKILRFATLRPRSQKEYNAWLKKHKVHASLHKELFNRLKHLELLDDEKFTNWWVKQRQSSRPKSARVLRFELRQKGIDRYIIDDVLSNTKIDEVKIAKELIEKKKYKWEKLNIFEAKKKISAFLASKGFSWDVVKKVLSQD